jgi:hypothetical protein
MLTNIGLLKNDKQEHKTALCRSMNRFNYHFLIRVVIEIKVDSLAPNKDLNGGEFLYR